MAVVENLFFLWDLQTHEVVICRTEFKVFFYLISLWAFPDFSNIDWVGCAADHCFSVGLCQHSLRTWGMSSLQVYGASYLFHQPEAVFYQWVPWTPFQSASKHNVWSAIGREEIYSIGRNLPQEAHPFLHPLSYTTCTINGLVGQLCQVSPAASTEQPKHSMQVCTCYMECS